MSNHVPTSPVPCIKNARIAIVMAEWNGHITVPLAEGASEALLKAGLDDEQFEIFTVPGAVELTFAASKLIETGAFDAVIVLGCVIKGDTPHFDYVCSSVTQGITSLNADCDIPVIFGVLTVLDEQQALDRAGAEAAETALRMIALNRKIDEI